jgi:hypothetical protein
MKSTKERKLKHFHTARQVRIFIIHPRLLDVDPWQNTKIDRYTKWFYHAMFFELNPQKGTYTDARMILESISSQEMGMA